MKRATFDLIGATCTSCSIGIEHMGRRIKGVEDIWVDRQSSTIHMDFDGNLATVDKITQFVKAIGYQANYLGMVDSESVDSESVEVG
jgi:copper chaperone CopZ